MDRPEAQPQTPRHAGVPAGPGARGGRGGAPGRAREALASWPTSPGVTATSWRRRVDSNLDDEHDPEGATIAFERAQVDALMVQARHRLEEVDAAEDRLDGGSYGRCEACGEAVAPARLEARPTARTCIALRVGQPSQFEGSIGAGVSACRREAARRADRPASRDGPA